MVKRLLPRPWQCCDRARWHETAAGWLWNGSAPDDQARLGYEPGGIGPAPGAGPRAVRQRRQAPGAATDTDAGIPARALCHGPRISRTATGAQAGVPAGAVCQRSRVSRAKTSAGKGEIPAQEDDTGGHRLTVALRAAEGEHAEVMIGNRIYRATGRRTKPRSSRSQAHNPFERS